MAQQATDEERRAIATWVLDNSGDPEALRLQVEGIWPELVRFAADTTHD
jgi:dephospho-CoA kinase